ncbi:UvrD-helicase domain-containing protein, partial [Francisella tularensis subsp. holarctica]|uniref:UvrD-helicase domain-containing protein n=1 Tax=Francisella tularensis TaxID=263 RepID=UPI002381C281
MLDNLNQQQQQAVKFIATPLLVLAGAGSGKTSLIIEKVSYLIEQLIYPAKS